MEDGVDIGVGALGRGKLVGRFVEAVKHARVAACGSRHAGVSQQVRELFTSCAQRVGLREDQVCGGSALRSASIGETKRTEAGPRRRRDIGR